jgi:hypothetical protein
MSLCQSETLAIFPEALLLQVCSHLDVYTNQPRLTTSVGFLQMIEYYEGPLFLTTSLVEEVDPAFPNSAHVTVKFDSLSPKSRSNIWRRPLTKKNDAIGLDASWTEYVNHPVCDILGKLETNGRDIRNLIRTAYGLAKSEKRPLGLRHVVFVMRSNPIAPNVEEVAAELSPSARRAQIIVVDPQDDAESPSYESPQGD